MTLYARQQKRHRCIEQSFGLCGRRRGWDGLREWHWNMYIIICEIDRHFRFNAWGRVLSAVALGWPWGMEWGGRWEGGSGWGTHVHPWLIHMNVWQKPPQYCKVISLQLKKKKRNKYNKSNICPADFFCQVGLYMGGNFLFKLLLALRLLLKTFSFPSKSIY